MDNFTSQTEFNVALVLGLFVFIIFIRKYTEWTRKLNLDEYNEKHKKKFKTYEDLQKHLDKEKEKQLLKEGKKSKKVITEPKKEIIEPRRESFTKNLENQSSGSDIGARLKKLRQMYKDGILSKVEFEKAKNKLLK